MSTSTNVDTPGDPDPGEATPAEPVEQSEPQTFTEDYVKRLRHESATHRRALRDTTAERDQLRTRVERQDRETVERLAAGQLQSPEDFWLTTDLPALRGEDGALDVEKVEAALATIAAERPHWVRADQRPVRDYDAGVRGPGIRPAPSFGEALKRRAS